MARKAVATGTGRLRIGAGLAALGLGLFAAGSAPAYVGESFLEISGLPGGWRGEAYRNWIKAEAHYWKADELGMFGGNRFGGRGNFRRSRMVYSGPTAPRQGADGLVISLDKHSPALPAMMARCASHAAIPEMRFAESSWLTRGLRELGPRPAAMPVWFEYSLKDARIAECPVVAEAPEQAFVIRFGNIEWLNYSGTFEGVDNPLQPAVLRPLIMSGGTKTFVLHWHAVAHDVSDDQCPVVNEKPSEADYYALVPPEEAAREKTERAGKGGVHYENGEMELRGPGRLNAALLPGIVRDPGLATPQTRFARGLDLDGNDGSGRLPAGICRHRNYVSQDGRKGIDNQLFTIQGCMPGHQGHKGFLMQYRNEQRRNGLLSVMVQVSGIDDERNDNSVDVTILYSKDAMAKSASGARILADYTFRLTSEPEFTHYFTQLRGRIRNGVIETEPVAQFQMHLGIDTELTLEQARMRLEIMPDGTLKGIVAGYEDWRKIMAMNGNSNSEFHYGYQAPAMYNAFKRFADGMKDPATGHCNGISVTYDMEGTPAFIPPRQYMALFATPDGKTARPR